MRDGWFLGDNRCIWCDDRGLRFDQVQFVPCWERHCLKRDNALYDFYNLIRKMLTMPYKSEAQRKKFQELLKQGKISKAVVDEFNAASKGKKLPERAPKVKKK